MTHPIAGRRTVLMAALVLVASGCTASPSTNAPTTEVEPVRLAMINTQTGDFSSLGQWEHKGAKLAIDQANADGGIHGRRIQLSVFDDKGDANSAVSLTEKVAGAGYVAILGNTLSGSTLAMAPTLAAKQIPAITSGQAPSLAALRNPFVFLNSTTSTVFDQTLAKHAVGPLGLTSFALISNDGAYGRGERAAFTAALAERGIAPAADVVVALGQKDFRAELTTIRQRSPQALFVGAEEVQSGLIVTQARALGITATILGGAPLGTDVYLNTAGAMAAEGTVFSTPYPTNDENEASRQFAAAYRTAFGEWPEFHGAKAYDGARILIQALRDSNLATGRDLADAIRRVSFTGLLGTFRFNAEGVGIQATRIATIRSGAVVAVAT